MLGIGIPWPFDLYHYNKFLSSSLTFPTFFRGGDVSCYQIEKTNTSDSKESKWDKMLQLQSPNRKNVSLRIR